MATPGSSWSRFFSRLGLRPIFVIPIVAAVLITTIFAALWVSKKIEQQNERAALEQEVSQLNRTSSSDPSPASAISLRPVSVRSTDPQAEVVRTSTASVVDLRLLWTQNDRYPSYRAVLRRVGDDQSFTIRDLRADSDARSIRLRLPAKAINEGLYEVELIGITSNGSSSLSEEYRFAVISTPHP